MYTAGKEQYNAGVVMSMWEVCFPPPRLLTQFCTYLYDPQVPNIIMALLIMHIYIYIYLVYNNYEALNCTKP